MAVNYLNGVPNFVELNLVKGLIEELTKKYDKLQTSVIVSRELSDGWIFYINAYGNHYRVLETGEYVENGSNKLVVAVIEKGEYQHLVPLDYVIATPNGYLEFMRLAEKQFKYFLNETRYVANNRKNTKAYKLHRRLYDEAEEEISKFPLKIPSVIPMPGDDENVAFSF